MAGVIPLQAWKQARQRLRELETIALERGWSASSVLCWRLGEVLAYEIAITRRNGKFIYQITDLAALSGQQAMSRHQILQYLIARQQWAETEV